MKAVFWVGVACVLLVACSSDDDPAVTASTSGDDGGSAAVSQGIDAATSEAEASATETPEVTSYIGLTGGVGVSLRDRCDDSARIGGSLAEGTLVRVLPVDTDSCPEWSFVAAGDQETWVRNKYLASDPPAPGASSPAPSGGTAAQPSATPTVAPGASGQPMFLSGSTKANTVVNVYVGGRPCRQGTVQPATGFWAADVSPGDACRPTPVK